MSNPIIEHEIKFKLVTQLTENGETSQKISISVDDEEIASADNLSATIEIFDINMN